MIVVSNTSPLTNLAAIGRLDLLKDIFNELRNAEAVWEELNAGGRAWPGSKEVAGADWIERHPVQNQGLVTALQLDLDKGEAESIALAVELNADLILLDETEGRRVAGRFNLKPLGVIGILLQANINGHIDDIRSTPDALRQQAGFYISASLFQTVLEKADKK